MDSIASSVNVAAPDALEAEHNIAAKLWAKFFQFIGKADYLPRPQTPNRSEWPLLVRPFIRGYEVNLVSGLYDSTRKSF